MVVKDYPGDTGIVKVSSDDHSEVYKTICKCGSDDHNVTILFDREKDCDISEVIFYSNYKFEDMMHMDYGRTEFLQLNSRTRKIKNPFKRRMDYLDNFFRSFVTGPLNHWSKRIKLSMKILFQGQASIQSDIMLDKEGVNNLIALLNKVNQETDDEDDKHIEENQSDNGC